MNLVKTFEKQKIEFIKDTQYDYIVHTDNVAKGYGISSSTIRDHKSRHSDELQEGKHWVVDNLDTLGGLQTGTFWTIRGILRLGMFIKSEQAKRFRDWLEDLAYNELNSIIDARANQLVKVSENLLNIVNAGLYQTQEEVSKIKIEIETTKTVASKAQEVAIKAQEEISSIRNFILSEQEKVKLRKNLKDKMTELANAFMFYGKEDRRISYSRIWNVLRRKYSFSKFEEMNPLYYDPAITYLMGVLTWTSMQKKIHPQFFKRNLEQIEPVPFPILTKEYRKERVEESS